MPQSKNDYRDKGYAWVILICASFNNFILIGQLKSMGILYIALHQTFDLTRGFSAIISITCAGLMSGIGPISTLMLLKFGYRPTILIGAGLTSLGIFLSYFASNGTQLLVTFGIIQGIGMGVAISPNFSITSQYFVKHLAKANGFLYAANSLGSSVFPPLIEYLVEEYGLKGAFLILSGISLHTLAASALLREPPNYFADRRNTNKDQRKDNFEAEKMIKLAVCQKEPKSVSLPTEYVSKLPSEEPETNKSLFMSTIKSGFCYSIIFSTQSSTFAFVTFHAIFPAHALAVGIDTHKIAYLITIASISDFFGRLTIGYFVDKNFIEVSTSYALSLLIAAIFIGAISVLPKPSYIQLISLSVLYSIGYGSSHLHLPVIVSHYMSPNKLPIVRSFSSLISFVLIFCSAPISTYFYEKDNNFGGVFAIIAVFYMIPTIGWFIYSAISWKRRRDSLSNK